LFQRMITTGLYSIRLRKVIIAFLTLHTWPEWILRSKSNKCRTLLCILITGISKLQNFKKCPQKAKKHHQKLFKNTIFFYLSLWAAQTAQTKESMFENVFSEVFLFYIAKMTFG
jgi:hypothetical protein